MLDMMPYPTSFSVIPIMKCLYHLLSQKPSFLRWENSSWHLTCMLENANGRDNQNDAKANLEEGGRHEADQQPADECADNRANAHRRYGFRQVTPLGERAPAGVAHETNNHRRQADEEARGFRCLNIGTEHK